MSVFDALQLFATATAVVMLLGLVLVVNGLAIALAMCAHQMHERVYGISIVVGTVIAVYMALP